MDPIDKAVPDPGNPQSYKRYSYVLNSPVNDTDPSGHWLESAFDIASIAYDLYDIRQNGLTWVSGLSLAADLGSLALPAITGGGLAVRAIAHADDATHVLNAATNTAEALVRHGDEVKKIINVAEEGAKHVDNLPPVVIGENMDRVTQYAEYIDGQTINDFIPATEWTHEKNISWAQQMREQGRKIVDIGPDFNRRARREADKIIPWSIDYNNERKIFNGYDNYRKEFARWGKSSGGSWIDFR